MYELFPYLLHRIGGMSFGVVGELEWQGGKTVRQWVREVEQFEACRVLCLEELRMAEGRTDDVVVRKKLRRLRKRVQQRKEVESLGIEDLPVGLRTYQEQQRGWEEGGLQFQRQYDGLLQQHREQLQELAKHPALLNGLCFSSHSFTDRLRSYLQKEVLDFRKKEFQTERTLLQYLCRTFAKTSPFSSFTTLAIESLADFPAPEVVEGGQYRFNQYLLLLFQERLLDIPGFYRQLLLRANPSIRQTDQSYHFLMNSRNLESLQSIEQNDFVDLVLDLLTKDSRGVQLRLLILQLMELVEADAETLEQYVLQLQDAGMLEWNWELSGTDIDWPVRLQSFLSRLEDFEGREEIRGDLRFLIEAKEAIANGAVADKQEWQAAIHRRFEGRLQVAQRTVEEEENFRHLKGIPFRIRKEQWIYEDCVRNIPALVSAASLQSLLGSLEALASGLLGQPPTQMQRALLQLFQTYYPTGATVDFLQLYEDYFKIAENFSLLDLEPVDWIERCCKRVKLSGDGQLFISLHAAGHNEQKHAGAIGALLQYAESDGRPMAYLDSLLEGHGKMLGRFLHLFPKQVTDALVEWNRQKTDRLLVTNRDASLFNANLHPPLLDYEIWTAGSHNQLASAQQISMLDLEVQLDASSDQLRLYAKSLKKEVQIVDLGLEALDSRSPMYRLLMAFAAPRLSKDFLTAALNTRYEQVGLEGIIYLPAIWANDHLLLQRRQWFFPKECLPFRAAAEKDSDYFLRINRWRKLHQLPRRLFITVHAQNVRDPSADLRQLKPDDYKPQYFDFESPLLVLLLERLMKRVPAFLKLEEMWPMPQQLFRIGEEPFVVESVLLWRSER